MDQCSLYLLKGCRMQRLHGLNPVGFVLEQSSHIQNKDEPRLERCCFFMAPTVLKNIRYRTLTKLNRESAAFQDLHPLYRTDVLRLVAVHTCIA